MGPQRELTADTPDDPAHVPFDDALDALGHVRRRKLLFALLDRVPQHGSRTGLVGPGDGSDARDRRVEMKHVHLPKLVEYGLVEWDRDTHDVTRGPNFDDVEPLLVLLSENEDELPDSWS